jgi:hypothetical protein
MLFVARLAANLSFLVVMEDCNLLKIQNMTYLLLTVRSCLDYSYNSDLHCMNLLSTCTPGRLRFELHRLVTRCFSVTGFQINGGIL